VNTSAINSKLAMSSSTIRSFSVAMHPSRSSDRDPLTIIRRASKSPSVRFGTGTVTNNGALPLRDRSREKPLEAAHTWHPCVTNISLSLLVLEQRMCGRAMCGGSESKGHPDSMEPSGRDMAMTQGEAHGIVAAEANTGIPLKGDFERMARRRFQRGSVFLRGTRELVWVGRWREDVIEPSGKRVRIRKTEVLGSKQDLPTKKLALRELGSRLAPINSGTYRALREATFAEFAQLWKHSVHKPSTQSAVNSNLKNWFVPYFGDYAMKDIGAQNVQMFVRFHHPRKSLAEFEMAFTNPLIS
jgi:hypothetical protein